LPKASCEEEGWALNEKLLEACPGCKERSDRRPRKAKTLAQDDERAFFR
jgi:hypothetical protein